MLILVPSKVSRTIEIPVVPCQEVLSVDCPVTPDRGITEMGVVAPAMGAVSGQVTGTFCATTSRQGVHGFNTASRVVREEKMSPIFSLTLLPRDSY